MLDIFNEDAFSVRSLTDAVNKLKFIPGRIGELGLFTSTSISTTTIAIEEKDGELALVAPTPRGGPGVTMDRNLRSMRAFVVPHFEINDAVMAESVQNVRAWGDETAVETVMGKVSERLLIAAQSLAATEEYARIGAVKGIITYADSSTLNLFTEFGVSQEAEVDFSFDTATNGAVRQTCADIIRTIAGNLGGLPFTGVHAFCGDQFFDDLIANAEVRASYLAQMEASQLRGGYVQAGSSFGVFQFGGITFENYRGAVGATTFVSTDKAHIFPTGVPGLFRSVYAPADYVETVNTMGQRLYAKQYVMQNGKGVNLDSQMNALQYCTRPKTLMLAKRT